MGNTSYPEFHFTSLDLARQSQPQNRDVSRNASSICQHEPSSSAQRPSNHSVLDPRLAANIKEEPPYSASVGAPVFRNEPYLTINHNAAIATVRKATMSKVEPSSSSLAIDPVREPYPNVKHDTAAATTPHPSVVKKDPSSSSPSATNASSS